MISKIPLAHLPTPVEELRRLTQALNGPRLLVKRDDQTGLAFGGNKTRKLEYLAGEALSQGARTLITGGAVQSNHCRQTAAAAARLGLDCILILTGEAPSVLSGNVLLDTLFGAELRFTTRDQRNAAMQTAYEEAQVAGRAPYLVPYGGSNATGAVGYASALAELLSQGVDPDWIVFASSSGGTQAGLVAGKILHGYRGKLLGISIDEPASALQDRVGKLASEVLVLLGQPPTQPVLPHVIVNDEFLGAGYGVMGAPEIEAIRLFARLEGLLLDPVYTGRAAAGLVELIHRGYFQSTETVLFWHTGGTPALLADRYREVVH